MVMADRTAPAQRRPALLFLCRDGEGAAQLRADHLAAHLDWVARHAGHYLMAGPVQDDAGRTCASVIALAADDPAIADRLIAEDPYRLAGVWASVERLPMHVVAGSAIGGISWSPASHPLSPANGRTA